MRTRQPVRVHVLLGMPVHGMGNDAVRHQRRERRLLPRVLGFFDVHVARQEQGPCHPFDSVSLASLAGRSARSGDGSLSR